MKIKKLIEILKEYEEKNPEREIWINDGDLYDFTIWKLKDFYRKNYLEERMSNGKTREEWFKENYNAKIFEDLVFYIP